MRTRSPMDQPSRAGTGPLTRTRRARCDEPLTARQLARFSGGMTWRSRSAYGDCPCGGTYERRQLEVTMGELSLTQPQGACPSCGSRIYKLVQLRSLEALFLESRASG